MLLCAAYLPHTYRDAIWAIRVSVFQKACCLLSTHSFLSSQGHENIHFLMAHSCESSQSSLKKWWRCCPDWCLINTTWLVQEERQRHEPLADPVNSGVRWSGQRHQHETATITSFWEAERRSCNCEVWSVRSARDVKPERRMWRDTRCFVCVIKHFVLQGS